MSVTIHDSWKEKLQKEFEKLYFLNLIQYVKDEYKKHTVYPPGSKIFKAFNSCSFDQVRVVILGQDPYHGYNQANGLCFSVPDGVSIPPSLKNIFKEIHRDTGSPTPTSGNLDRWAQQGVLLLNATLTVRASSPGSHQHKGWEIFTDSVIQCISQEKNHIVFMLWGAYAQKKSSLIDPLRHKVLTTSHPSPFSVDRGFLGCGHFTQANAYLKSHQLTPIVW